MPPTPSRFHYIFNLRDLSRVCAGLCQTTADAYKHSHEFLRVWRNECLRVFHDRLISVEDQDNVKVNITIITDFYKVAHSDAAYFNQKPVSYYMIHIHTCICIHICNIFSMLYCL